MIRGDHFFQLKRIKVFPHTRVLDQLVTEFVARAGAGGFTVRELIERLNGFDDRRK